MRHDQTGDVTIVLAESDYANLIQLLDTRIKSEHGRVAAFKGRHDYSNLMVAKGRMSQLVDLKNAVVAGCRLEVDDV